MNSVSIIINGVRYDAEDCASVDECATCDLKEYCDYADVYSNGGFTAFCAYVAEAPRHFKKSDKKFEK
jgi:hypothetical protein